MRAVVQRVSQAAVRINGAEMREMGPGFVVFLGVGEHDTKEEADKLWSKISKLRIFKDAAGKTNLSLDQVNGNVMLISQFTLWANCKKGNRPSFIEAANPQLGNELYEYVKQLVSLEFPDYVCGEFGAEMDVSLVNQGPFTIWLDTETL